MQKVILKYCRTLTLLSQLKNNKLLASMCPSSFISSENLNVLSRESRMYSISYLTHVLIIANHMLDNYLTSGASDSFLFRTVSTGCG